MAVEIERVGRMLKSSKLAALAAVLAVAAACNPAPASAQANCQWYGTTALKQQQDNERMKCGLSGPSWHSDLKMHVAWCASVPPELWREQARQREQALAACAAKLAK